MTKNFEQEELASINVIAAGTTIQGELITSGDFRIDGTVKGNVTSNSKVIIGRSGLVEGDIKCNSIEIEGVVKANIVVNGLLSLKETADLVGNIYVDKIAIEPGANFNGSCKMQNYDSMETPEPATDN